MGEEQRHRKALLTSPRRRAATAASSGEEDGPALGGLGVVRGDLPRARVAVQTLISSARHAAMRSVTRVDFLCKRFPPRMGARRTALGNEERRSNDRAFRGRWQWKGENPTSERKH